MSEKANGSTGSPSSLCHCLGHEMTVLSEIQRLIHDESGISEVICVSIMFVQRHVNDNGDNNRAL